MNIPSLPPKPPKPKPVIAEKWEEGFRYRYDAKTPNLSTHPKGWSGDFSGPGVASLPPYIWPVPRRSEEPSSSQSSMAELRPNPPLAHYRDNFGKQAVQQGLPIRPAVTRKASQGEFLVGEDFKRSIAEAAAQGQDPRRGEFIATYAKTEHPDGRVSVNRLSLQYFPGRGSKAPEHSPGQAYVIHSHPFEPDRPSAHGPSHPLGAAYPSGADYLAAQDPRNQEYGGLRKEMLLHGDDLFLIHPRRVAYLKLDPP